MKKEIKAISTLVMILLILIFTIIGAFISYMWVMASFYNMPEDTTLLIFESLAFPSDNFTYFNVTVLNPSNSVSDINITAFLLNVVGTNETQTIGTSEPQLPFLISKGTSQSFRCIKNWSSFAGETVTVESLAGNASTKSYPYTTTKARLLIFNFNATENIQHFNLTVENPSDSALNLTISNITIDQLTTNINPSNVTLSPGHSQVFRCDFNWGTLIGENATIKVETVEGFEQDYLTSEIQGAFLYVSEVKFDYTNSTYFNVTVRSLEQSEATARLTAVNLTLPDKTIITLATIPTLDLIPLPLPPNQSLSFRCLWDWNAHRNETVTVDVYTKQGFNVQGNTATTPLAVEWTIDSVDFDVNDEGQFSVNVTNTAISLQTINVTKVEIDQNLTTMNSALIDPGTQAVLVCDFNWSSLVGKNATITVHTVYGLNESVTLSNVTIPYVKLENVAFSNFELGNPYLNVTVFSSQFSKINANITKIFVKTVNGTFSIDGTIAKPKISPSGYDIAVGTQTVFTCPWDWNPYIGQDVTVVAQTSDGLQVSMTSKVP